MRALLFFSLFFLTKISFGQQYYDPLCRDNGSKISKLVENAGYVPDGKFYSFKLATDEKMEIMRSFFATKEYYIMVTCEECLPGVEVSILKEDKTVVVSTKEPKQQVEIAFKPQRSQNMYIALAVANSKKQQLQGCVNMVVGYR